MHKQGFVTENAPKTSAGVFFMCAMRLIRFEIRGRSTDTSRVFAIHFECMLRPHRKGIVLKRGNHASTRGCPAKPSHRAMANAVPVPCCFENPGVFTIFCVPRGFFRCFSAIMRRFKPKVCHSICYHNTNKPSLASHQPYRETLPPASPWRKSCSATG